MLGSDPSTTRQFVCYDDVQAVGPCGELGTLLKKRLVDQDVDSDEEQVEACVAYMQDQLFNAAPQ